MARFTIPAPRLTIAGATVVLLTGLGIGIAMATDGTDVRPAAAAQTVSCPTVADRLPAVPAASRAEVDANLAGLERQIAEANQRLATSVGQGGPDFVQNAILGPLADKRRATLERITIAIGRHGARPVGLESLAACRVVTSGEAEQPPAEQPPAEQPPAEQPPAEQPPAEQPPAEQPPAAGAQTVSCPTVADKLPAVPAAARAEVDVNLAGLERQIAEANQRLATSVGQGGANFVQNAILGPLADKRRATLERIALAIGRHAARPTGLEALAACTAN